MGTKVESTAVVTGDLLHRSGRKLADHSIRDALQRAAIEPARVDLLLNAGLFHDRVLGEPALAALIQQDVALNPEDPHGEERGTFSFDVANGSAGVLSALQIADGFLRAGTIEQAVIVAGDADPGHGIAPHFPYDPVGAALVCGWSGDERGFTSFRWLTSADGAAAHDAVVRLDGDRNHLHVHEDETYVEEAAAIAGKVATELLAEKGHRPDDVAAVVAAPFETTFLVELAPHLGVAPGRIVRPSTKTRFHTAGLIAAFDQLGSPASADGAGAGEWVLVVAAGAGISAGAALYRR